VPAAKKPSVSPPTDTTEQDAWKHRQPSPEEIETRLREYFEEVVAFVKRQPPEGRTFLDFEHGLVPAVFAIGRLLATLFLCRQHELLEVPAEIQEGGRRFRRKQAQSRELGTLFGKVRYWRTYAHAQGGGFYPLDRLLRLPADGFGFGLTSLMTRVATKVSFAQTTLLLRCFLGWSPSTTSVERAVLGLGRRTQAWFEESPVPEGEGDVLVIMIDSKAPPTATESELKKRRGKRRRTRAASPRHRGRKKRKRRAKKKRRKKGDHSKNGRAATLVVMYTLKTKRRGGKVQRLGPINRRIYDSFAKKRHAFAVAQREAKRRGFGPDSGKLVQVVVDGELSFGRYAKEYFPDALLTLDSIHAIEYLWKAGRSFYREGSKALEEWVAKQRNRLYAGKAKAIVRNLRKALAAIPKTGPGNKGKRKRLGAALNYLAARVDMMNYDELLKADLEISSGPVEGAVRYVIGQRFDSAGMRWIRERAEALLQLRCVEVNGEWDAFMRFVESKATGPPGEEWRPLRLHAAEPGPLPTYGLPSKAKAA
jgi:hypothetical protein